MKFLNDERIECEDGEVKMSLRPVTTSQQARMIDLGSKSGTEARIELTRWLLKNLIDKITISGADFDPAQLADKSDLSDTETFLVMLKIGQLACDATVITAEDVKK